MACLQPDPIGITHTRNTHKHDTHTHMMGLKLKKQKKPALKSTSAQRGAPLSINNNVRSRPAKLKTSGRGTVVSHTEIIKENLLATAQFTVSDLFAVQPALTAYSHGSPLGAWLAGVAKEYDNYEFESLRVHYKTTCSSLTNGQVIMSYDPNPDGAPPSTLQSARNAALCQTGPVRENVTLDLTSQVKGRKLLTRSNAVTSYPAYDAGRFIIATSSGVDGTSVGFLEIEYVVRLSNPQTSPAIDTFSAYTPPLKEQRQWNSGTGTLPFGNTSTTANASALTYWFGNSPSAVIGTSLITPVNGVTRVGDIGWTSPSSGAIYTIKSGQGVHTFKFKRPGLYRVRFVVPGDWQNLAQFCTEVVRFSKSASLTNAVPNYTTDVGVDTLGNPIGVYSQYYAWRGFKTLDTVGASENDDMALDLDAQVFVADVDDYYSLFIGIRPVASITENGTATYISSSNSAGIPRATIEYLGACEGTVTATVLA